MTARLASGIWVSAYLRRLQALGIPAYVITRGDETAGAVLVKLALMDGTARAHTRSFDLQSNTRVWQVLVEGPEPEVDAAITRQRGFDPDLWVIEVEDARGRDLLAEMD
ncbi:DUF1491 family protein [Roseinatronobacter bogoriensis]|uniref:DUF1491 domain-containing protein n=1 Tax=Roseinatronobacter bogoriensis subsp. barguzinensis TaxID=441209 RepID=A0A2K8KAG8_9RHOB|nr:MULTISPECIES: DUF1491 family protein [Rhodobaca]ATX66442.1 DUF1491 domain-containing protein [Rhodobaca barguzinensis]MBB4207587.1 hypothetical protein [Rhodobaca bogoriensis DSM 18756]TDW40106.1 hypothetical protein LY39_01139 [Rhodobaca barguzinensis]TDY70742.1 hypothetical protein EV660_102418 [Rhodobaca bogoriensis DSM 18756]